MPVTLKVNVSSNDDEAIVDSTSFLIRIARQIEVRATVGSEGSFAAIDRNGNTVGTIEIDRGNG